MNYPKPLPWMDEVAGAMIANRNKDRHDLRERALYNAVQLHCETGDSMAILNRATIAAEVIDTAQEFYDWITGHPNLETLCTCGHEQDEHKPVGGCGAYNITAGRELHCRCDIFERQK